MGRKKHFSLIEISVAMAVASIGVAAIMALLPLAIKSSSDSVGDTLATDVANSVLSQIDSMILEDFDVARNLPSYVHSEAEAQNWHTSGAASHYPKTDLKKLDSGKYSEFKEVATSTGTSESGHWQFFFGPEGGVSDFGADVWCFKDDGQYLSRLEENGQVNNYQPKKEGQAALIRVYIEISWPITRDYYISTSGKFPRETRLFVREYFDPTYSDEVK